MEGQLLDAALVPRAILPQPKQLELPLKEPC